jgi:sulfotransferase
MKRIIYLGGLPRSGSTLLCNILAQNTSIYVSKATSGCSDIFHTIKQRWPQLPEHIAEGINEKQMYAVMNATLQSYHNTFRETVIDKSRNWLSMFEEIEKATGEKPKIVAPVRNLTQILASFEKLWRKNKWEFSTDDYFQAQTLEGRCDIWSREHQVIGVAYNRVKDIISRGHKDDVLFLEFDLLTSNPTRAMELVYNYLELPNYQHNFDYVEQYTQEDDLNVYGIPDLHTIRNKVQPVVDDSREILGDELHDKYSNLEVWR